MGYTFRWEPFCDPVFLDPDGKEIPMKLQNFVPYFYNPWLAQDAAPASEDEDGEVMLPPADSDEGETTAPETDDVVDAEGSGGDSSPVEVPAPKAKAAPKAAAKSKKVKKLPKSKASKIIPVDVRWDSKEKDERPRSMR